MLYFCQCNEPGHCALKVYFQGHYLKKKKQQWFLPFNFMCNSEIKYYYFFILWRRVDGLHKCLKLVFNKPKYILFWYSVASYFNCEIFLSTIEYIEHFQAWTWHCCKWLSCSFVGLKHAWSGTSCMPQCIWWSGCASSYTPMRTACVKVECVCIRPRLRNLFL